MYIYRIMPQIMTKNLPKSTNTSEKNSQIIYFCIVVMFPVVKHPFNRDQSKNSIKHFSFSVAVV